MRNQDAGASSLRSKRPAYVTIQGDTWDIIAFRMYNNERLMHILIEANPQYINIAVFSANCVLDIPEVPTAIGISFPPWRAS